MKNKPHELKLGITPETGDAQLPITTSNMPNLDVHSQVERMVECVNAMTGIKKPQSWVHRVKAHMKRSQEINEALSKELEERESRLEKTISVSLEMHTNNLALVAERDEYKKQLEAANNTLRKKREEQVKKDAGTPTNNSRSLYGDYHHTCSKVVFAMGLGGTNINSVRRVIASTEEGKSDSFVHGGKITPEMIGSGHFDFIDLFIKEVGKKVSELELKHAELHEWIQRLTIESFEINPGNIRMPGHRRITLTTNVCPPGYSDRNGRFERTEELTKEEAEAKFNIKIK